MKIKENVKDVTIANTKIYKILSGGGYFVAKDRRFDRVSWT